MKKKELLEVLQQLDDDAEIVLWNHSKIVDISDNVIVKDLSRIKEDVLEKHHDMNGKFNLGMIERGSCEWNDAEVVGDLYETKQFALLQIK